MGSNLVTRLDIRRDPATELLRKIEDHTALVGVVGLGYVGLPFAVEKARCGFHVVGIEQNPRRAAAVQRGESYIGDVESEELRRIRQAGLLEVTTGFERAGEMDVIVICVPTPLTRELIPDLQYVEGVTREVARRLRPGQLVSLESTTYPGTTEELMLPILESSGLVGDRDFFLAHSPERVDPGNRRYTTRNINKVVGGVGRRSLEVALAFYSKSVQQVVPTSSVKVAELVKVFENTFRAVNIALVNELAVLCDRMGLSVWEVLDAAFTKPFGIMPFYPGPGVGGHCIPVDPHYLEWKAREYDFNTRFIALAGEINRQMPAFVVEKALRLMRRLEVSPSRARVLALGVAYKKDLGDCRESPAHEVLRLLHREGVELVYHDPYVPRFRVGSLTLHSVPLAPELLRDCDLTLILTDHTSVDYSWVVKHSRHVFDTRNATHNVREGRERITCL